MLTSHFSRALRFASTSVPKSTLNASSHCKEAKNQASQDHETCLEKYLMFLKCSKNRILKCLWQWAAFSHIISVFLHNVTD